MEHKTSHIILGIDPGTNVLGFGVISIIGKTIKIEQYGILNFKKELTHYEKLGKIYEQISEIITQYKPNEVAIEAPFFGKNIQSMLKLGRAQGVAIAATLNHKLPIFEYAPKKIKQSITGSGSASKETVSKMVQQLTGTKINDKYLDSTDALAAAICHHFQRHTVNSSGFSDWSEFVKKNEHKILKGKT